MTIFKKILASIILLIWFVIGIYFGTAGLIFEQRNQGLDSVVDFSQMVKTSESGDSTHVKKYIYEGMTFSDKKTVELYIKAEKAYHTFKWLDNVPEFLTLILTSCALGAFGGLISVVRMVTHDKVPIEDTQFISIPFLGLLLGMVVLGISYVIPSLLTVNDDIKISHTTLVFFSLFAGLFSKQFLTWLDVRFESFLKEKKK